MSRLPGENLKKKLFYFFFELLESLISQKVLQIGALNLDC